MALTITQYGGGSGSFSGDCCQITWEELKKIGTKNILTKHHILIDLGQASVFDRRQGNWSNGILEYLILTHIHQDHIGGDQNRTFQAVKKALRIILPNGAHEAANKSILKTLRENEAKLLDDYKTKLKLKTALGKSKKNDETPTLANIVYDLPELTDASGVKFKLYIIQPDHEGIPEISINDENWYSLGVAIKISYKYNNTDYFWTYLTLGDMVPSAAEANLVSFMDNTGNTSDIPADSKVAVKLAHHSSKNNYMNDLMKVIENGMGRKNLLMISSGYAGGVLTNYKKKLEEKKSDWWMYFLFDNQIKNDTIIEGFIDPTSLSAESAFKLRDMANKLGKSFDVFDHVVCSFDLKSNPPIWEFNGIAPLLKVSGAKRTAPKDRGGGDSATANTSTASTPTGEPVQAVDDTEDHDDDDNDGISSGKEKVTARASRTPADPVASDGPGNDPVSSTPTANTTSQRSNKKPRTVEPPASNASSTSTASTSLGKRKPAANTPAADAKKGATGSATPASGGSTTPRRSSRKTGDKSSKPGTP